MPIYWNQGTLIDYSVQESEIDGYSDEVVKGEDGYTFTVTNNHIPAVVDVLVDISFDDDDDRDGLRPDAVHVVVAGSDGYTYETDLSEENGFTLMLTGINKYWNEGEQVVYTVTQDDVKEYSISLEQEGDYTFYFLDVHVPETKKIVVTKIWDDAENQDGLRKKVTFTLTGSDGSVYEKTMGANSDDLTRTFKNLYIYYNHGTEIFLPKE